MHLKSLKLLAMSITVRELTKCSNTVLNLVLYVHIPTYGPYCTWSPYFADVDPRRRSTPCSSSSRHRAPGFTDARRSALCSVPSGPTEPSSSSTYRHRALELVHVVDAAEVGNDMVLEVVEHAAHPREMALSSKLPCRDCPALTSMLTCPSSGTGCTILASLILPLLSSHHGDSIRYSTATATYSCTRGTTRAAR
jgi:hypothetical protein